MSGRMAGRRPSPAVVPGGGKGRPAHTGDPPAFDQAVVVDADGVRLAGRLTVPEQALGAILFAHAGGSSRFSPRDRYLAAILNDAGLATALFDLLTPAEEADRAKLFAIEELAARLGGLTRWLCGEPAVQPSRIGYFGASTGAAAALWAAAEPGAGVMAVVSRAGRPDLAADRLPDVRAPTLLIVGGNHSALLDLNRRAQQHLRCENRLVTVPGAAHLLAQPGALRSVAELAREWFLAHLTPSRAPGESAHERHEHDRHQRLRR